METRQKNQSGSGLGVKFGPNSVQSCEKTKETGIVNRFFSYFTWGIPFKAKNSGSLLKGIPFKANI